MVDRAVFGTAHLYHKSPIDPEGLLGVIPSVAHTILGFWGGKILYGTCTNKHHLALTDATWDERVAVICLIVCVAGLGMAPFWVSHMIGESVLPVVSQLIP
jgi:NADH:ubiquinone oxidoreductase subunit 4 (subunit M)